MSDLVVLACNTVLFDFFAVHEISRILCRHISVAFNFFCICNCFEIVQSLHPLIRMGSVSRSRALLLVWMKIVNTLPLSIPSSYLLPSLTALQSFLVLDNDRNSLWVSKQSFGDGCNFFKPTLLK